VQSSLLAYGFYGNEAKQKHWEIKDKSLKHHVEEIKTSLGNGWNAKWNGSTMHYVSG
jgi:hypothetical protein